MTWLDTHRHKLMHRQDGFETIAKELLQYEAPVIVETGGLRDPENVTGDGTSTMFFDDIARATHGEVVSVDIDPVCAANTERMCSSHTWAYTGDSLEILPQLWSLDINCLYLDSFDVDFENDEAAARHALHEYLIARRFLQRDALVCVDDNNPDGRGKGRLIATLADLFGWECLSNGYVKVWRTNGYL